MGSNQSQTYSSTMMNTNYNISGSTSVQQQQQADSDIEALSRFLAASSSGNDPQQQPIVDVSVSDQAMAAFLAATTAGGSAVAYPDNSNFGISVQDSPLAIASIEITPSPSMQQPQFSDLSQDAALAAAGFAAAANGMATTPLLSPIASAMQGNSPLLAGNADMDSPLSSHSFSGFGSNALNSMLGGSGVPVHNSYSATGGLSLPQMSTSSSGFLLPPGSCGPGAYSTGSILGKRTSEEAGLPIIPVGVPLSKRVTMPASYGGNLGDGPTISSMPIPSGVSMHRIASYHPGAMGASPLQNSLDITAGTGRIAKVPISRLKSTSTIATGLSASNSAAAQNGSLQPPTQHQRKVAHNAIERRYRNNINDRIRDLRNAVPALQHIRPKKKPHQQSGDLGDDSRSADEDNEDNDENTHIDGVEAATKLNKATILGKSTEYIYYLRRSNDQLKRESLYMQEIIRSLPNGEQLIMNILQKAKQDSSLATTSLHMPEKAMEPEPSTNE